MTLRQRFDAKVNQDGPIVRVDLGPCWIWTAYTNAAGYGQIGLGSREQGTMLAHRLAWTFEHGDVPPDVNVLHRCDNPACVRPAHLFLGSQIDNIVDMRQKGRGRSATKHGEAHPLAKLTAADVRQIRAAVDVLGVVTALARRYGVNKALISRIRRGNCWRHIAA